MVQSFIVRKIAPQRFSSKIVMVGENENAPWSAIGVSMISKIQAPTRARSRSRPRRRLMALRRCGVGVRTTDDSTTTFQLQNRHGGRERKRPVVGDRSFYDFENLSAHQCAFALEAKQGVRYKNKNKRNAKKWVTNSIYYCTKYFMPAELNS
jgi:hypothetical protein